MHTPGPWKVNNLHTEEIWAPDVVHGRCIAVAKAWPKHDCEANARLIAAAPCLLAACEGMSKIAEDILANDDPDGENGLAATALLNAIARVKGA